MTEQEERMRKRKGRKKKTNGGEREGKRNGEREEAKEVKGKRRKIGRLTKKKNIVQSNTFMTPEWEMEEPKDGEG